MKAIIISHERGGSYVMDRDGSFHFVKGHTSRQLGAEIEFRPASSVAFLRYAMAVACLVIAIVVGGMAILWNSETYSVHVDMEPSVELTYNRFNQLKKATPLNDSAVSLLEKLKLSGSLEKSLTSLIQGAEQHHIISKQSEHPEVLITVIPKNGKTPQKQISIIYATLDKIGMTDAVFVQVCGKDSLKLATEMGVTPGKVVLAEQLFESDRSIPIDELVGMTIGELLVLAKEKALLKPY